MIQRPETTVNIRMSLAMRDALEELAVETDMSIGQLVREALHRFLGEFWSDAGEKQNGEASMPSPNDQVLERCRQAVTQALSVANDWKTMQDTLASRGCEYRALGGGLAMFDTSDGSYLCKASSVGPGYSKLIKRFRAPFPGHPHTWLADRVLARDL
jgi:hypothetical protein